MIEEIRENSILGGGNKRNLIGLSTDTKPTIYDGGELEAGSTFTESNTGYEYVYNGGSWWKKKSSSGGSGGITDLSSFTTDELTQGTTNLYLTNDEKTNYENVVTEVTNARNSKADLNTRLNGIETNITNVTTDLSKSTQQIAEITNGFSKFGIKGDGTTDDTVGIQSLFDYAVSNKVKKIVFPKSTYLITKPIYINGDNIDIDLNGSTINWNGTANIVGYDANNRNIGIFNIWGSVDSTATISGIALTTYNGKTVSNITVSDHTLFTTGDYIHIEYYTFTRGNYGGTTDFKPAIDIIAQVIQINGDGTIMVGYASPYNFGSLTTIMANLHKLAVRKNVSIKNFNINDMITATSTYATDGTRATFVSGIGGQYNAYCTFENIRGYNTKFPIVNTFWSYRTTCKNIYSDRPGVFGSGEGYGVQFVGCLYPLGEYIAGNQHRHSLDFSRCAWGRAHHITGTAVLNEISIHAECDHNHIIEDSEGNFGCGNGLTYFPEMVSDITLVRCNIQPIISQTLYSNNFHYKDCTISILDSTVPQGVTDVKYTNCRIQLFTAFKFIECIRGLPLISSLEMNNCKITSSTGQILDFNGIQNVKIIDTNTVNVGSNIRCGTNITQYKRRGGINLMNTSATVGLNIIGITTSINNILTIMIEDIFVHNLSTNLVYSMCSFTSDATNITGGTIYLKENGNVLLADTTQLLGQYMNNTAATITLIKSIKGNIIKNARSNADFTSTSAGTNDNTIL